MEDQVAGFFFEKAMLKGNFIRVSQCFKSPTYKEHTKHIEVDCHFICEKKEIQLEHTCIEDEDQVVEFFFSFGKAILNGCF